MKKKLAIFQSDLHVGGIQKSLINLLHMLSPNEYEIDVFLFDKNIFYPLKFAENVCFYFYSPLPFWNRFIYFKLLYRFVQKRTLKRISKTKYDVAIDFSSYRNECAIGALLVDASKRILWIHNNIEAKRDEELKYRILLHFFKAKFKYFDNFAVVSRGIITPYLNNLINGKPIKIIPNFINVEEIIAKSKATIDFHVDEKKYNLISMGRLCYQKGFDLLLETFALVRQQRTDMHLYIIGDGPDLHSLIEQCDQLELNEFVTFLGSQVNPFPFLKKMDGFVLNSRYEGQGMVLWEAKVIGLPVFMPKHLEIYNEGLTGYEDLATALIDAQKEAKKPDNLRWYNDNISKQLANIFMI